MNAIQSSKNTTYAHKINILKENGFNDQVVEALEFLFADNYQNKDQNLSTLKLEKEIQQIKFDLELKIVESRLATEKQIAEFKESVHKEIAEFKESINKEIAEIKRDMLLIQLEIQKSITKQSWVTLRWMFAFLVPLYTATIVAFFKKIF